MRLISENFPNHAKNLGPCDMRFHDAQGNNMPVVGQVSMCFRIGDCRLQCQVIVFRHLNAALLLGVNAMASSGLVINLRREILFVDPLVANGKCCEIPIKCRRGAKFAPTIACCDKCHTPSEPHLEANIGEGTLCATTAATSAEVTVLPLSASELEELRT